MARATFAATALAVAFVVLLSAKQTAAEDGMNVDELLGRFRTIAQKIGKKGVGHASSSSS